MDEASQREGALREGFVKGTAAGELEAKRVIAKNLLTMGMDRASVQKATGLSEEELKSINN
jgi:predicted transposase/invertase (TIGR01784 family)